MGDFVGHWQAVGLGLLNLIEILLLLIGFYYFGKEVEKLMATVEDFDATLKRIDDATNGIAQTLRDLQGQITGGGLSSDVENEVLIKLDAAATKLEGVGKPDVPPTV